MISQLTKIQFILLYNNSINKPILEGQNLIIKLYGMEFNIVSLFKLQREWEG